MKIEIENLKAEMTGRELNAYQKSLARMEFKKLLDYLEEFETLNITKQIKMETYKLDAITGKELEELMALIHQIHNPMLKDQIFGKLANVLKSLGNDIEKIIEAKKV
jgi:hypothetical protein